jgi:hypothetical protein
MLNTRESRNACKDKESRRKLIKLFKIMETKDELKKAEELLDLKELENVEGGTCSLACESGCLWSGKSNVVENEK